MKTIHFCLLSSSRLDSEGELRAVLEPAIESECLAPDYWNTCEPVNRPFNVVDVPMLQAFRWTDLYWRKQKPKAEGYVTMAPSRYPARNHAYAGAEVHAYRSVPCLLEFAQKVIRHLPTDYALCHEIAPVEVEFGAANNTIAIINPQTGRAWLTVTSHQLRKYIPDLYWANVFGKPYIDLFGRQKLLSAPAYEVVEIAPDCIWIQLSPSIEDMQNDYGKIIEARKAIKEHLNPNAFFQLDLPPDHKYDVPEFGF